MESRVFSQGLLSKETTYELIVRGPMRPRELAALIGKLQFDLEMLGTGGGSVTVEPLGGARPEKASPT